MLSDKLTRSLRGINARSMLSNFISLSSLQAVNYVLPLITLPYLLRVLGPTNYGLVSFSQALIQYFIIFTDYGFALSATKEISIHRDNKVKIAEIFSSVMIIKLSFMCLAFVVLGTICTLFTKLSGATALVYLSFGMVFGNVLFPVWFFQGMEDMKYITLLNLCGKLVYTLIVFAFVRNSHDINLVPLANSLSSIVAGTSGIIIVLFRYRVPLRLNFRYTYLQLREGFFFFLSRISITLYTSTNAMVIGNVLSMRDVGIYALAVNIVNVCRSPFDILNTVIYPYMSFNKNKALIRNIIKLSFFLGILIYFGVFLFSNRLALLFGGGGYESGGHVLRILALIIVFISVHVFLGSTTLVVFGFSKYFNLSVIFSGLLYVFGVALLYFFGQITLSTLAFMTTLVELSILCYRFFYVKKFQLLNITEGQCALP